MILEQILLMVYPPSPQKRDVKESVTSQNPTCPEKENCFEWVENISTEDNLSSSKYKLTVL